MQNHFINADRTPVKSTQRQQKHLIIILIVYSRHPFSIQYCTNDFNHKAVSTTTAFKH